MDMEELFIWLEGYSGAPFDFSEAVHSLSQFDAFEYAFEWRVTLMDIFTKLDEALDIISEHKRELPSTFPPYDIVKRELARNTVALTYNNIKQTLGMLGIDMDDVQSLDDLKAYVVAAEELITMCVSNTMETINKEDLFDKHEEDSNDSFANILDIHVQDMERLHETITGLHQQAIDMLEDDEDL